MDDSAELLSARARRISSHFPSAVSCRCRRAAVCHDPSESGSSLHVMPVWSRNRIAFTTVRASALGRPRRPAFSGSTMRLTSCHCSSVSSWHGEFAKASLSRSLALASLAASEASRAAASTPRVTEHSQHRTVDGGLPPAIKRSICPQVIFRCQVTRDVGEPLNKSRRKSRWSGLSGKGGQHL